MSLHIVPISRRRLLAHAAAAFAIAAGAKAETAPDGVRILRARPADAPQSFGYNGAIPGPTLRVRRGEELRVRLVNELSEPTSIHWHGVRVPNTMDGVPGLTQPPVLPGASFDYRFRPPDAGTFWYHASATQQTDRGLHGALIVEDAQNAGYDRDIVLLFGSAGGPDAGSVLVNGGVRPDIPVTAGERLRLRLINATAARGFALRIDRHAPWLVAVDGQPAEPFVSRDGRVALAPGGRVDLIMDAVGEPGSATPVLVGLRDEQPIAQFLYRANRGSVTRRANPLPLPQNPLPPRIDLRNALRLEWNPGSAKLFDPAGAPLFTARRGRPVALALPNTTGAPQVVHLHGHSFRHLDRLDDGWKPYWLDTFVIGAETERIAFVADNPGKWLIASRTLDQPDRETQACFLVS